MKLGSLERWYVNGPLRDSLHQPWVLRWFMAQHPLHQGSDILEIGCGDGNGLFLLQKKLMPNSLFGIDFDPKQVHLAQKRMQEIVPTPTVRQGDATALPFDENSFHAAFCFTPLHHIPDWQRAITECHRTLKRGGYIFIEEYTEPFLSFPLVKLLLPHPEERFTHNQLRVAIEHAGLNIIVEKQIVKGCYSLFIARKSN